MSSGARKLENGMNKFRCLNGSHSAAELAEAIRLTSPHAARILNDILDSDGDWSSIENRKPRSGWDQVSLAHFRAALAYRLADYPTAYIHELDCYHAFLRVFLDAPRWCIPVLYAVSSDLSHVAKLADAQVSGNNRVEEAIRAINQGFSLCMTDREPSLSLSRKWGTYHMANLLFALYLRQRAYNLCGSMIRAIRASELPALDTFPMSDQVTFRFYRGMLAFRSEDYSAARHDLLFAFQSCHRDAYQNKRRILTYLVPLMLIDGQMPRISLLQEFPAIADLYSGLISAAKSGNLGLFDRLLAEKQDQLASLGVFLAIERVRKIALRQLFYKVYLIDNRSSRIALARFRRALEFALSTSVEDAEVEAILADMVFSGYLKGYLAHDHGLAVLSKQMPFPPISSVVPPNGS
ncbi:COP9 signalosome (CSN) subunit [Coemansia sp. RSA 486]|nr:COP9 signalosome (CSN) subunit [Coemansia sp. RSA 486]KAJ2234633.1 COP9 signalosome (CSN) subunit [Coemansia sp. RSA 485]